MIIDTGPRHQGILQDDPKALRAGRTSNHAKAWNIEWEKMKKQSLKPELLDDILQETEELIKIFVTSIKTAEKKQK